MEHNKELATAWDFVEHTGTSIFLTGKAGTGKTTFLKTIKERSSKRMIVVAPTGVAAINAAGMTIHSFFQLPLTPYVPGAAIRDRYDFSKEKRRIIRSIDMVVIDEISMVRADLLDAIDFVLRRYRDATQPFGGAQLLMIGDLQQLTPVVTPKDEEILRNYYSTPYFFGSKALQQINYVTIQLTRVYRQQDEAFINILNHIRDGKPTQADLALLNQRCKPFFIPRPEEGYIRLTTHNNMADSYNENELRKLSGRSITFTAEVKGEFPPQNYPAEERLTLKAGAQVMFIKNDPSGRHLYYNGRIGHITSISNDEISVRCAGDEEDIKVEPQEWENTRYVLNPTTKIIESQVQGVFRQYPLRLAWAITIHKSQGLTFEHAIIDAGRSFASGQVYVALSRCKSLEGLVLASPIEPAGIINDGRVSDYIARQQQAAEESIEQLPNLKEEYYRLQLLDMFNFTDIYHAQQMLNRVLLEHFRSYPKLTLLHKLVLHHIKTKVIDVAYKWLTVIRRTPVADLHAEEFLLRVKRSADYFAAELKAQIPELLEKTKTIDCQSQRTAELLEERYKDLWLAYLQKENLLDIMAEERFAVNVYMRNKQETLLDAMEKVNPGSVQKKRRRRKTTTQ